MHVWDSKLVHTIIAIIVKIKIANIDPIGEIRLDGIAHYGRERKNDI